MTDWWWKNTLPAMNISGMHRRTVEITCDADYIHEIMSCSKSFTSACIGIAIAEGYLPDVNASIFDFLPDHQQYRNQGKENITIEHFDHDIRAVE